MQEQSRSGRGVLGLIRLDASPEDIAQAAAEIQALSAATAEAPEADPEDPVEG